MSSRSAAGQQVMAEVRVLVGTRKGAFVLTADGARKDWKVAGPHFAGLEVYHVAGSPAAPDRVWAAPSTGWFGQQVHRSDDGGRSWTAVGSDFTYAGVPGTHQWYDGTPHPWEFARVWHLEPSATDPDTVLAGVEDAALFRSVDGGSTWSELPGLREHGSGPHWQPGAGGMCLHTILPDPRDPARMLVAISAAGVFRTDDGGATWRPTNAGLVSEGIPDPDAEVGHCVHKLALHPDRPDTVYHAEALGRHALRRRRRALARYRRRPAHRLRLRRRRARPRAGDRLRPPDHQRRRALPAGRQAAGLPQPHRRRTSGSRCRGDCHRSTATSTCCGTPWRSTASTPAACTSARPAGRSTRSADAGDTWAPIVRDLPAVLSVEVQTLS